MKKLMMLLLCACFILPMMAACDGDSSGAGGLGNVYVYGGNDSGYGTAIKDGGDANGNSGAGGNSSQTSVNTSSTSQPTEFSKPQDLPKEGIDPKLVGQWQYEWSDRMVRYYFFEDGNCIFFNTRGSNQRINAKYTVSNGKVYFTERVQYSYTYGKASDNFVKLLYLCGWKTELR